MVLKSIIAATAFSLAGFFGCSKTQSGQAGPSNHSSNQVSVAAARIRDLGVLQLTNHYETCVVLGPTNNCRIVPQVLDHRDVQITLTLETKGPDGHTAGLSVARVVAPPDKPLEVLVGGSEFSFTPEIVAE